jgi:hypothetical protein
MKKFKLTATDSEGVLIEIWIIGEISPEDEEEYLESDCDCFLDEPNLGPYLGKEIISVLTDHLEKIKKKEN